MRQTLKRLTRMTAGYGMVQWAGPFLSFIFTPIITRILLPADYGVADFVLAISTAAGTLALFAMPQALTAHFNDYPEQAWKHRLTGGALLIAMTLGLAIGAGLFLGATLISQSSFGTDAYMHLFQIVGLSMAIGVCGPLLTSAAQAALRVRSGMVLSASSILSVVAGNILFIIVLRLGAAGMVSTAVVSGITVGLTAIVVMRRSIAWPSQLILRQLLSSGALLFPNMVAAWALLVVDRLFLVQYVSTESLGYYAIANKIASLLIVLMGPIYAAWTPLALAMQHEGDAKQRYAAMSRYLIGAVLIAALGLGLFSPEILLVLTRAPYLPAAPYVGFLAYVHVFSAISTVLYTSALAGKQLGLVSATTLIGAAINILLNFLLIPNHGVWGATIATVIGYGVSPIGLYLMLRWTYPVPYPIRRILAALVIQFGLLLVGAALPTQELLLRLASKVLLLLALPVGLLLIGIITPRELGQLWGMVRRRQQV